jgi:hypothetical protein
MITDICIQFNGHGGSIKHCSVSLPAIICTGEAGLAASWLNKVSEAGAQLDVRPLRKFLKDGVKFWNIAGMLNTNREIELDPDNAHRHLSHANRVIHS